MKQPELKFGRPVIANRDGSMLKGVYVKPEMDGHYVYFPDGDLVYLLHVKPDLSAPPMNGDKVAIDHPLRDWAIYVGLASDGYCHVVEIDGRPLIVNSVRHPQPEQSKREKLLSLFEQLYPLAKPDQLVDDVLKITEES